MKRSGKSNDSLVKYTSLCWTCEKKVQVPDGSYIQRAYCPDCEKEYTDKKAADLKEYVRLKALIMHERALRILEKQNAYLYQYKEASGVVLDFALMPGEKFSSSHEMVAAMELIRNRIKIKTQQSIGSYRVDFVIPEMNVVFEVDGYMHKSSKIKDNQRDIDLRQILGSEWEVVRISTDDIEKRIGKLVVAIDAIAEYKRDVRSKHNGILPEWYSSREMNHYSKVINRKFKEEPDDRYINYK
ncbi:hypothetical protein PAECIP111893_02396 [Paenibacillus plantiphilus]|uniref:DUF559 domain-containing protein n=1 Tax=Paenibacillus plantiphilus TaxID=2905650 RepID=A0ABM9C9C5_9BACL|nr:DUF559 domain-containing protein [Paenibacillus plantiphilus]CAH1205698.1 hypothetical protein PAECIP111893_02396 [Paenibacillus plantiphilus]